MTYTLDISDQLDKQFAKLRKKDKKQLESILDRHPLPEHLSFIFMKRLFQFSL